MCISISLSSCIFSRSFTPSSLPYSAQSTITMNSYIIEYINPPDHPLFFLILPSLLMLENRCGKMLLNYKFRTPHVAQNLGSFIRSNIK